VELPKTRYARSADGAYIAFQVFGEGPVDLLWISPWFSDVELLWEYQPIHRFFKEMASFARVILMDQRGIGLSDKIRGFADRSRPSRARRAAWPSSSAPGSVLWPDRHRC
jgi:pimeloyl-ACP methyl ester carboxylesterase